MKTIFCIISGNAGKKYAYNTDATLKVGDQVKIEKGNSLVVTNILDKQFEYVNSATGSLGMEITSTSDVKISTLVIREGASPDIVFGQLVEKE